MTDNSDLKNTKNHDPTNTLKKENKISLKKFFLKGFLFILCAIPGLAIFLFFSVWIMVSVISSDFENPPLLLTPLIMSAAIVLMLIGTGKLKEFKYIAVFLFIPISLILYGLLDEWKILGSKTIDIALFVGLTLFFVNSLIIMHYQKKRKLNGTNKEAPSDTDRPTEKKESMNLNVGL
jgi:O-antigen ligase